MVGLPGMAGGAGAGREGANVRSGSAPEEDTPDVPRLPLPDPAEAADAPALLRILKVLVATRQSLDWQLGRGLALLYRRGYDRELGFDSFEDYVERRLGIGVRRAETLVRLDDELEERPALRDAYRSGALGWNTSWLVVRATKGIRTIQRWRRERWLPNADLAAAWVARASRVTVRRLEAETQAMENMRVLSERAWLLRTGGLPPSPALLTELGILPGGYKPAYLHAIEAAVAAAGGAGGEEGLGGANVRSTSGPEKRPHPNAPAARINLRAPPDVANFFQRVLIGVRRYLQRGNPEWVSEWECLLEILLHFAHTHSDAMPKRDREYLEILERDGWRCIFPGCGSRELEVHHFELEAMGGPDVPANKGAACPPHHRPGVHGGRAKVVGTAPWDLLFLLGRREDGTWREAWRHDERIAGEPDPVVAWKDWRNWDWEGEVEEIEEWKAARARVEEE